MSSTVISAWALKESQKQFLNFALKNRYILPFTQSMDIGHSGGDHNTLLVTPRPQNDDVIYEH